MKIKKLFIVLAFLFVIPPSFAEGFGGGYKYYDGGFIYTNATLPLSAKKRNEENFFHKFFHKPTPARPRKKALGSLQTSRLDSKGQAGFNRLGYF